MPALPKHFITPQEYLARERAAETRSEYLNGEMFAMSRASFEHTLIKDNFAREAGNQLQPGPCRVLTSDMRVKVNKSGPYTYPDIVIVCDKPQFEDQAFDTLLNPQALVEILSDSTEKYDRGKKFAHFRTIPSLKEVVFVTQDRPSVERFVRQPDQSWTLTEFNSLTQSFQFASIAVSIPLAKIYCGIELPENPGR